MNGVSQTLLFSCLVLMAAVGLLSYLLINTKERAAKLQQALAKMRKSFNELDEQARLIVKTDMELNKAQEELDKRLNSLDALQKTSRLISITLDENEIFHRLDQSLMTDLGFEKNLILIYDKDGRLQSKASHGFFEDELAFVVNNLERDISLCDALKEGNTFSSSNSPLQRKEAIVRLFGVEQFVLAPIITQNGIIGIVFFGNRSIASGITEGDEELVSILANQIGQSLENARLFEEVFRSRQSLELKVQERTRQLESLLEEVKEISKKKSEFVSAVSHELRTPLTSIKGYASILISGKLGDIPAPAKERLVKINTHSDNLVKLINDLLDISRIESGRFELALGKCDITAIIENVGDMLVPQFKAKNIRWEAILDDRCQEVFADRGQLERVFINLIGNAVKFTPEAGTISVRTRMADGGVEVSVADTGIGISEDDISRLFDEFYRVENKINQNVKGTGLGLALVKKIIEAHGGRIWVESKLGEGTSFHFTLPPTGGHR